MRATVTRAERDAFVASLGVAAIEDVLSVSLDADKIIVEERRRDEDGNLHAAGAFIATVTTEIAIVDGPR